VQVMHVLDAFHCHHHLTNHTQSPARNTPGQLINTRCKHIHSETAHKACESAPKGHLAGHQAVHATGRVVQTRQAPPQGDTSREVPRGPAIHHNRQ
jgi:hypothetical protein